MPKSYLLMEVIVKILILLIGKWLCIVLVGWVTQPLISNVKSLVWKLKINKKSFLHSMFKYPKMNDVTQTLLKIFLTKCVAFFRTTIFNV